jgi:hypothetical protein
MIDHLHRERGLVVGDGPGHLQFPIGPATNCIGHDLAAQGDRDEIAAPLIPPLRPSPFMREEIHIQGDGHHAG